ncbi:putative odorant-binding protein A5 [Musca autumnalis]|uniref:putative odorant-binding protein A5 n=1 Tax=Musca autumnalis TaxID=221902 RepID=UPI003CF13D37
MFTSLLLVVLLAHYTFAEHDLEKIFKDYKVIPDMIDEAPKEKLKLEMENGLLVGDGLEYKPADMASIPHIDWPSVDPNKYYSVYMGSPDAPDTKDPRWAESIHWLVLNVPGNQVEKGELYCEYIGPFPPRNSGSMRYVYLVYEQPNKMDFDEKVIDPKDGAAHMNYKIKKFAEKYNLGRPVAGNLYRAQWDETVEEMHKRISLTFDD